jgi:molecular chaperone DnaK (HSP70)
MANAMDNMIVGLDIGTSKVVAIVGQITSEGVVEVVGLGSQPSRGMKKGVVVDIEATVRSIQRAVEEAELMAGCQIHSVYAGIAGSHVRSLNSHGIVAIRDREVMQADIDRVIDAAQAVAIPADQKTLHVLPQEYVVDNQEGVREPVGMSGVRLEAKVHLVTCAVNAVQNIEKCVRRCGLEVEDVILEQLASAHSTLTEDERELGVCIVDIGGGTSDFTVCERRGGETRIIASAGIRLGGTDFDKWLSLRHVMPLLGYGAMIGNALGEGSNPAPRALFHDLATWEKIAFVYGRSTLQEVRLWQRLAEKPPLFARLGTVLESHLGHEIAYAVEAGKIAANRGSEGVVELTMVESALRAYLSNGALQAELFESAGEIATCAQAVLTQAGWQADQVERVIFVGGSSLLGVVQTRIAALFPSARLETSEVFTAVVDGLALATR